MYILINTASLSNLQNVSNTKKMNKDSLRAFAYILRQNSLCIFIWTERNQYAGGYLQICFLYSEKLQQKGNGDIREMA